MSEDLNKKILEGKEAIVLEFVKTIKDKFGLDKKLTVVFCDGFTPMGQEALACIEPATGTIYISRIYLDKMGMEEIKKVVAHEITHMFETEHTPAFYKLLNEFLSATWEPDFSTGIVSINGSGRVEKPVKKKKEKEVIDKTVCNKHSCNITTNLKRCIHCRGYFCVEHIKPSPPSLPNFDYPNKFNEWKQKKQSHPCPNYYDYLVRKHKENMKAASDSLDRMSNFRKEPAITISAEKPAIIKSKDVEIEPTETCSDCGKDLKFEKVENWYDDEKDDVINVCSDCYDMRRKIKWETDNGEQLKDKQQKLHSSIEKPSYRDHVPFWKKKRPTDYTCPKCSKTLYNTKLDYKHYYCSKCKRQYKLF